ncbi:HAMP domain-containing histidine kinase [bacterium]|nr:MAG: HAMP domain-containing histidine kinase [bacterium]
MTKVVEKPSFTWTPALKLTAWYLGFIMLLSLTFSIFVYRVSLSELERGLRRPSSMGSSLYFGNENSYNAFRQDRLRQGEVNIRANLLLFNIIILVAGGGVSYFFARRTIRPIEEALEAQTRFSADASHELRTPLAVMQTETEVALRDSKLTTAEAKEVLKSNLEEVVRVRSLAEGLLRLARSAGELETVKKLNLANVVELAMDRMDKPARARKIKIEPELARVFCRGDQENLAELAVILLDNAVKYSQVGKTIWLKTYTEGKHAVMMVADEGEGIKASQLEHIFERFYRADTSRTKQKVEGFGIGLSIAKQIVEAHGGFIEAHSELGVGTTFLVKIPKA